MMFRFFIFIFLIFTTSSNSGEISSKVSEYVSNLIPGEGDTEVSIDLRENNKPDYSILAVREIQKTEDGNFFTQFSFFNTEKNIQDDTTLSPHQQRKALQHLKELQIIETKRKGIPAKMHYKINTEVLVKFLNNKDYNNLITNNNNNLNINNYDK